MPQISWEIGDFFESEKGATSAPLAKAYGVVTSEERCVLVGGSGGRMGWVIDSTSIPDDAVPSNLKGADFAVRMSLVAITVGLGIHSRVHII